MIRPVTKKHMQKFTCLFHCRFFIFMWFTLYMVYGKKISRSFYRDNILVEGLDLRKLEAFLYNRKQIHFNSIYLILLHKQPCLAV